MRLKRIPDWFSWVLINTLFLVAIAIDSGIANAMLAILPIGVFSALAYFYGRFRKKYIEQGISIFMDIIFLIFLVTIVFKFGPYIYISPRLNQWISYFVWASLVTGILIPNLIKFFAKQNDKTRVSQHSSNANESKD